MTMRQSTLLLVVLASFSNALYAPKPSRGALRLVSSTSFSHTIGSYLRASSSSTDEVETSDDLHDFLNELADVANTTATITPPKPPKNESSHFMEREKVVGIGGNSGFTYDVNALKRNLVQESVRGCKQELLVLLGDGRQKASTSRGASDGKGQRVMIPPRSRRDRDDLIEERLASLVQVRRTYLMLHDITLGCLCM
jgi:hypothetical protein